jgi:hypothetical protein
MRGMVGLDVMRNILGDCRMRYLRCKPSALDWSGNPCKVFWKLSAPEARALRPSAFIYIYHYYIPQSKYHIKSHFTVVDGAQREGGSKSLRLPNTVRH